MWFIWCLACLVSSTTACCSFASHQPVIYSLSVDKGPFFLEENRWTTVAPHTFPTSSPSVIASTSTTKKPQLIIYRDNCTEEESRNRDCYRGECYVQVMAFELISSDRFILCECDPLYTGERCDEPKSDLMPIVSLPKAFERLPVGVSVVGVAFIVIVVLFVALSLIAYCVSFSYYQCCSSNVSDERKPLSTDSNEASPANLPTSTTNQVRRRRNNQDEIGTTIEDIEITSVSHFFLAIISVEN